MRNAGLETGRAAVPGLQRSAAAPGLAQIEAGQHRGRGDSCWHGVEAKDPFDWRPLWYRGRALLAQKRYDEAQEAFNRIYSELPGELAPKLALALAAELSGDLRSAIRYYDVVSRTDPEL